VTTLAFSAAYSVSDRAVLTATVPITFAQSSRFMPDTSRHENRAQGLGDVTLTGDFWLAGAPGESRGNVAVGIGVKAPTGATARDAWHAGNGSVTQRPVDETIQPGDGGWGVVLQVQAYRRMPSFATAYFVGRYLVSPGTESDVPSPIAGVNIAIPDVYSATAGMAFDVLPRAGLSVSVGARLDGVPVRDLAGTQREDSLFRRPGHVLFIDPGVAFRRGRGEFNVGVPVRLRQYFGQSLIQESRCALPRLQCARQFRGGGGVADFLIHASYTHRL
jgi:hypothetical protein